MTTEAETCCCTNDPVHHCCEYCLKRVPCMGCSHPDMTDEDGNEGKAGEYWAQDIDGESGAYCRSCVESILAHGHHHVHDEPSDCVLVLTAYSYAYREERFCCPNPMPPCDCRGFFGTTGYGCDERCPSLEHAFAPDPDCACGARPHWLHVTNEGTTYLCRACAEKPQKQSDVGKGLS